MEAFKPFTKEYINDPRRQAERRVYEELLNCGLPVSIFMVIRPAIFTDIQPPWERGELTIIRL